MSKLLANQPQPVIWAILTLPAGRTLRDGGWKTIETTHNGGYYERVSGLQARCRGLELPEGVRWWHVIVGRRKGAVGPVEIASAMKTFFPPTAMVLQVHVPDSAADEDEASGMVVHLWWAVDGLSGVPPVETWDCEPWTDDSEDQAPRWE